MVLFFRTLLFHALPATYGPLPSCNGVVVIGSFIFFMKDFPPSAAVPKVVRNLREPWGQAMGPAYNVAIARDGEEVPRVQSIKSGGRLLVHFFF